MRRIYFRFGRAIKLVYIGLRTKWLPAKVETDGSSNQTLAQRTKSVNQSEYYGIFSM